MCLCVVSPSAPPGLPEQLSPLGRNALECWMLKFDNCRLHHLPQIATLVIEQRNRWTRRTQA